jgi:hypothetical protein
MDEMTSELTRTASWYYYFGFALRAVSNAI